MCRPANVSIPSCPGREEKTVKEVKKSLAPWPLTKQLHAFPGPLADMTALMLSAAATTARSFDSRIHKSVSSMITVFLTLYS
jgi:hypothetical protein